MFLTAKHWQQSKCPPAAEWLNQASISPLIWALFTYIKFAL
jgi:hypothetical protein